MDPELETALRIARALGDVRGMDRSARSALIGLLVRSLSRLEGVDEADRRELRRTLAPRPR